MSDETVENNEVKEPVANAETGREGEDKGQRGGAKGKFAFHKKVCRFCSNKSKIDYKDADTLRHYTTERGNTGTCAKHQRELARAIKRARNICLLPFVAD